jgi:Domain of unknown function DUF11/Secretion system C-terminal sorting domain
VYINGVVLYLKDNQLIMCNGNNPDCGVVSGSIFIEKMNANCILDTLEFPLVDKIIKITPGPIYVSTDFKGRYSIVLRNGNYNISSTLPPYYNVNCPTNFEAGYDVQITNGISITNKNFSIQPMTDIQDLVVNIEAPNPLRPGFETDIYVSVRNKGNTTSNAKVKLIYPSALTYLNTTLPFASNQNQEMIWNINNLAAGQGKDIVIRFKVQPDVTLIRTNASFYLEAFPEIVRDGNLTDNIDSTSRVISGAYDPNDKQSKPVGPSKEGKILSSTDKFEFTIRFQNTGNDTAFNIVVRDTLESVWNPLTVKTIATSHKYRMVVKEKNIIEWHFDNILLQDSFRNEPASHGFITFEISPIVKPLSIGTQLKNKAGIYFDFNPPIITNTTLNQVVTSLTSLSEIIDEKSLKIEPNPVHHSLNFDVEDALFTGGVLTIYNTSGKVLISKNIFVKTGVVDVTELNSGSFICTIKSKDNKVFVNKFIKVE